jgi:hypothetical protein
MKGVSVLITVLLVGLAQQLAQGLKRNGALPLEHQVRAHYSGERTTRSFSEFARSAALDEERTRLENDSSQSSSGALQKRLSTGRTPKPFARFAATDLRTGNPSLLSF